MTKREMRCPHKDKISDCSGCMAELNAMAEPKTIEHQIVEILDEYRKTCYLVRETMSDDKAVHLQALANVTTKDKLVRFLELREQEARVDENQSFKSVFEDAATWVPKCYMHEKPSSYCHACKKRKWFALLAQEVMPIIDERIKDLTTPNNTSNTLEVKE